MRCMYVIDAIEVNRLLAASREAHDAKKRKAGIVGRHGRVIAPPNWPEAEQHIVQALHHRLDAHDLDPQHVAPGWRDDRAPDANLIRFYLAYSKPFITEADMARVVARFPAYAEIEYIP